MLLSLVPADLLELLSQFGGVQGMNLDDLKRFIWKVSNLFHTLYDGFVPVANELELPSDVRLRPGCSPSTFQLSVLPLALL